MDIKGIERFETHSHSHYSNIRLLDSINRPKDMILTSYKLGLKGLCITDHEALCGHVEFLQLEKSLKKEGKIPEDFKIGLGNEIYLTDNRERSQKYYHFILIAKDTIGHKQLRKLSSQSWYNSYFDRGMERVPTLKSELKEIIEESKGHIIATTACLGGELPELVLNLVKEENSKNKNIDIINSIKTNIVNFLKFCSDLFGSDFYIEIAPNANSKEQIDFNNRVKNIAKALNIKMIFATDAHYLTVKDRPMHKAYLNSKNGEREVDGFYSAAHLMDNQEAFDNLYPYYSESEFLNLCNNTMEIYNKIEKYDIFHNSIIPEVKVKSYEKTLSYFENEDVLNKEYPTIKNLLTSDNLQERYWINECLNNLINKNLFNDIYIKRIETEADVIKTISEKLGNCLFAYFNTFQHYIDLFWECGSIVGPGRGSAVGFLSNYLLGITQLDPIKWDLDYWRFLNKERIELP